MVKQSPAPRPIPATTSCASWVSEATLASALPALCNVCSPNKMSRTMASKSSKGSPCVTHQHNNMPKLSNRESLFKCSINMNFLFYAQLHIDYSRVQMCGTFWRAMTLKWPDFFVRLLTQFQLQKRIVQLLRQAQTNHQTGRMSVVDEYQPDHSKVHSNCPEMAHHCRLRNSH